MSANPLYLGLGGPAVAVVGTSPATGFLFQFGAGFFPIEAPNSYAPYIETWEVTPVGPTGVTVFRAVTAVFFTQAGYTLSIVPVVDGIPLTPTTFNDPSGGVKVCEAPFFQRGRRLAAQLTFGGFGSVGPALGMVAELDFFDVLYTHDPVRAGYPA